MGVRKKRPLAVLCDKGGNARCPQLLETRIMNKERMPVEDSNLPTLYLN